MTYRLFEPLHIGTKVLRNRTLRAAAFEGMAPNHRPSPDLVAYHRSVSAGKVGMSTVAYAAVEQSGLAFPHQLWLRKEIQKDLQELTHAIKTEGALASIQIGHCGNMANPQVSLGRPLSPSGKFNFYGTSWPRAMDKTDIARVVHSFGDAVRIARDSGFDAVEVHAGHGYLISQFLSPLTNRRTDEFGGSLPNRMRFMRQVISEVRSAAKNDLAVLVKMNLQDGKPGGQTLDEAVEIATCLEQEGADALILSGGFVSAAPMYVMRGEMPLDVMSALIPNPILRMFVRLLGPTLVPPVPFQENYFLHDAQVIRSSVKLPLIYVGGIVSRRCINEVLAAGFEGVAIARALIADPAFVAKLEQEEHATSVCDHCNYCAARIYTTQMACHKRQTPEPPFLSICKKRGYVS
jgi:2,4-dienoyl-CoA reductase-like NADH-dependent reductase (Old Yellow Enzyme family)